MRKVQSLSSSALILGLGIALGTPAVAADAGQDRSGQATTYERRNEAYPRTQQGQAQSVQDRASQLLGQLPNHRATQRELIDERQNWTLEDWRTYGESMRGQ
jgi:hypothetical protein